MNRIQFFQFVRFVAVGGSAAAVHFSVVILLVQSYAYLPLVANVVAFLVSFQVGYWGHRNLTFSGTEIMHREAYPKLVVLQLFNFGLNELFFFVLLGMHLPYQLALFIVLATLPLFTFAVSKFWVFQG